MPGIDGQSWVLWGAGRETSSISLIHGGKNQMATLMLPRRETSTSTAWASSLLSLSWWQPKRWAATARTKESCNLSWKTPRRKMVRSIRFRNHEEPWGAIRYPLRSSLVAGSLTKRYKVSPKTSRRKSLPVSNNWTSLWMTEKGRWTGRGFESPHLHKVSSLTY